VDLPFQPDLFAEPAPSFDPALGGLARLALDATAWIDLGRGVVRGADALFEALLRTRPWAQRSRWMYDRRVLEPRLTAAWTLESGAPLEPPILEALRHALSRRYGVRFDSVGFNLYRDGRDGVAWHGDRIRREVAEPVVPLLSLGAPRRLLVRPRAGGPSRAFLLGPGDLLVMGGRAQRTWQHGVPKVARAVGPRISVAYRHDLDPRGYGRVEPGAPA
jgi:alkylated DNA repair dioxygenase AlkB